MDYRDRTFPRFDPDEYRDFEVCPTCNGKGSHVNPSIDSNGITADEMFEFGEEFADDYRSGVYDVPCAECRGLRVVPDDDEYRAALEANYEIDLEIEAERRMGC